MVTISELVEDPSQTNINAFNAKEEQFTDEDLEQFTDEVAQKFVTLIPQYYADKDPELLVDLLQVLLTACSHSPELISQRILDAGILTELLQIIEGSATTFVHFNALYMLQLIADTNKKAKRQCAQLAMNPLLRHATTQSLDLVVRRSTFTCINTMLQQCSENKEYITQEDVKKLIDSLRVAGDWFLQHLTVETLVRSRKLSQVAAATQAFGGNTELGQLYAKICGKDFPIHVRNFILAFNEAQENQLVFSWKALQVAYVPVGGHENEEEVTHRDIFVDFGSSGFSIPWAEADTKQIDVKYTTVGCVKLQKNKPTKGNTTVCMSLKETPEVMVTSGGITAPQVDIRAAFTEQNAALFKTHVAPVISKTKQEAKRQEEEERKKEAKQKAHQEEKGKEEKKKAAAKAAAAAAAIATKEKETEKERAVDEDAAESYHSQDCRAPRRSDRLSQQRDTPSYKQTRRRPQRDDESETTDQGPPSKRPRKAVSPPTFNLGYDMKDDKDDRDMMNFKLDLDLDAGPISFTTNNTKTRTSKKADKDTPTPGGGFTLNFADFTTPGGDDDQGEEGDMQPMLEGIMSLMKQKIANNKKRGEDRLHKAMADIKEKVDAARKDGEKVRAQWMSKFNAQLDETQAALDEQKQTLKETATRFQQEMTETGNALREMQGTYENIKKGYLKASKELGEREEATFEDIKQQVEAKINSLDEKIQKASVDQSSVNRVLKFLQTEMGA